MVERYRLPPKSETPRLFILGVDPGASAGGLAYLDMGGELIVAFDLPTAGTGTKLIVSPPVLAALVREWRPHHAVIERVGSMPGQGVSSTFKFGRGLGMVEGVLGALEVPMSYVSAVVWKKHFKLSKEKDDSRQLALQLWPKRADLLARKKDHGRAEAALIARWFLDTVKG